MWPSKRVPLAACLLAGGSLAVTATACRPRIAASSAAAVNAVGKSGDRGAATLTVFVASAGYPQPQDARRPAPENKIFSFQLSADGKLTRTSGVSGIDAGRNPSSLVADRAGRFLYATNEQGDAVAAFAIDRAKRQLTFLNRVAVNGAAPTHVTLDTTEKWLLVANYGGSLSVLRRHTDAGTDFGKIQEKAPLTMPFRNAAPGQGAATHGIYAQSAGDARQHLYAVNKDIDSVALADFNGDTGALQAAEEVRLPPGTGPRHMAIHPSGAWAFLVSEKDNTLTAVDLRRSFIPKQPLSTLPADYQGTSLGSEVQVSPSGRFVYASNRGHDSLAIFRVINPGENSPSIRCGEAAVPARGEDAPPLRPVGFTKTGGRTPRHFAIDPSGRFLLVANQDSDAIVVFRIDDTCGTLTQVGQPVAFPWPAHIEIIKEQQ